MRTWGACVRFSLPSPTAARCRPRAHPPAHTVAAPPPGRAPPPSPLPPQKKKNTPQNTHTRTVQAKLGRPLNGVPEQGGHPPTDQAPHAALGGGDGEALADGGVLGGVGLGEGERERGQGGGGGVKRGGWGSAGRLGARARAWGKGAEAVPSPPRPPTTRPPTPHARQTPSQKALQNPKTQNPHLHVALDDVERGDGRVRPAAAQGAPDRADLVKLGGVQLHLLRGGGRGHGGGGGQGEGQGGLLRDGGGGEGGGGKGCRR